MRPLKDARGDPYPGDIQQAFKLRAQVYDRRIEASEDLAEAVEMLVERIGRALALATTHGSVPGDAGDRMRALDMMVRALTGFPDQNSEEYDRLVQDHKGYGDQLTLARHGPSNDDSVDEEAYQIWVKAGRP